MAEEVLLLGLLCVLYRILSLTFKENRVGGKRSSFLPIFVFRPLTPPRMRFRTWRFFI